MRMLTILLTAAGLQGGLMAQERSNETLDVVGDFDINRYMGSWYEIARLPNTFQNACESDVVATYSLLEDGDIEVINRCKGVDGEERKAKGKARRASADGPLTKLEVRFAPAWLSILPFVWGDYWIIDLAPDYSYAVVGEPGREYFWILARKPVMDDATFQGIVSRAKEKGYELSGLLRTKQGA